VPDRNGLLAAKVVLALLVLCLLAGPAAAYVGPGPGLELVGYSVGLLWFLMAAVSATLLYPFYAFLRWLRGARAGKAAAGAAAPRAGAGSGAPADAISAEGGGEGSHVTR
jgi:hypothetical protein